MPRNNGSASLLLESGGEADKHNVTDFALGQFREHYGDQEITKDEIYEYVYGILHARDYHTRYKTNLRQEAPRIPLAEDFRAFVCAGRRLMEIHIGYESVTEYLLIPCKPGTGGKINVNECVPRQESDIGPDEWRIEKPMKRIYEFEADGSQRLAGIKINSGLGLIGIPPEANRYDIAGDQPIECAIKGLKHTPNNDPNDMFERPVELRHYLQRLVWLSIESAKIIDSLPPALPTQLQGDKAKP